MTITELITMIREDYLSDTFSGWESASQAERDDQFAWSDASLLRYITEAEKQACMRTDFLYQEGEPESTITLVSGTQSYAISPKITFVEEVIYNDETVTHVTKKEGRTQDSINTSDSIRSYSIRQRKMFFHPPPVSTDDGEEVTLSLFHSPFTSIESEDDDLSIPEEYHRDLIWWVLYEAYRKRDVETWDETRGLESLQSFNDVFGLPVSSEVRLNQLQEPSNLTVRPLSYTVEPDEDQW